MKEILQVLWGAFVLLVFVAVAALKCDSDRIKEQRTREWLSGSRAVPKFAPPGPDSYDPFGPAGGSKPPPAARAGLERPHRFLGEVEPSRLRRMRSSPPPAVTPAAPLPRVVFPVAPMPRLKARLPE